MGVCVVLCLLATFSVVAVWTPIFAHRELKDATDSQPDQSTDYLCCLEMKGFFSINSFIRAYL